MVRFVLAGLVAVGASCGGPSVPKDELLRKLQAAMGVAVNSPEESQANSRLVEDALEANVFQEMTREQVRTEIGAGDACSRHPQCMELGFDTDDWYYEVGQMGDGPRGLWPVFVLGFDASGKVSRTWNLRVH